MALLMARILVASLPFAGHVGPMAAVAAELVSREHDVVAYTGAKYHQRFVGATWLPWTRDFDDADLATTFPRVGHGKGLRRGAANVEDVLVGTGASQARDILAAGPFDLFVTDHLAFGAGLAGELLGVPWASVAVTPLAISSRDLPPPGMPLSPARTRVGRARDVVLRGLADVLYPLVADPMFNRMRVAAGLAPGARGIGLRGLYSPHLVLAQGVPGLEYPRSDLPPYVHFVGRLAGAGPLRLPEWWPELMAARAAGRPVVHVTQGTLDTGPDDLLRPSMAALAGHEALVVCTTPVELGPLPHNVRTAAFVPHDQLLPMTDVMITNGGWGGVLAAVQSGVPLVVAAGSLDKPEVARRVAWSSVGLDLRTGRPRVRALRRAVDEVLRRPELRQRAAALGTAITAAGGVRTAATLLEKLSCRKATR